MTQAAGPRVTERGAVGVIVIGLAGVPVKRRLLLVTAASMRLSGTRRQSPVLRTDDRASGELTSASDNASAISCYRFQYLGERLVKASRLRKCWTGALCGPIACSRLERELRRPGVSLNSRCTEETDLPCHAAVDRAPLRAQAFSVTCRVRVLQPVSPWSTLTLPMMVVMAFARSRRRSLRKPIAMSAPFIK